MLDGLLGVCKALGSIASKAGRTKEGRGGGKGKRKTQEKNKEIPLHSMKSFALYPGRIC